MTDVDRYITDEALGVSAEKAGPSFTRDVLRSVLRRVLPGILARHRADVLHDLATELMRECKSTDSAQVVVGGVARKARMADEAVADE